MAPARGAALPKKNMKRQKPRRNGVKRWGKKSLGHAQCHLVNGTGRREEHKMLRHHAFAR